MTFPFSKLVALQRVAAEALSHPDAILAEAIMHHCALKVASSTAPTDKLVGIYVTAEIKAKHRLLRLPISDLAGLKIKGKYLAALSKCEDWQLDLGTIDALIDGMVAS